MQRPWTQARVPAAALLLSLTLAGCSLSGLVDPPEPPPGATPTAAAVTPTPTPVAPSPTPSPAQTPAPTPEPKVTERPSTAWKISSAEWTSPPFGVNPGSRAAAPVEGFADHTSVASGDRVRLFVSTGASRWRAEAFRMGWYAGKQGASVWKSGWRAGKRQPPVRTVGATLTPVVSWQSSLSVQTTGWRPGTYLIRLTVSGHASYIPLTVRSDSTGGKLVLLAPDTTWQAYNDWGGRNLYWGPAGKADSAGRARKVTFDRPYAYGKGAGEYLRRMLPVVALAEKLKLPVAYLTDVDLERGPAVLKGAHGLISMGHDEYYSVGMRTTLEKARDRGTNLAFLGANAIFRRIRYEKSALGPRRNIVNYKAAAEDPRSATKPSQTTADWPAAPAADPESSLIGSSYACFPAAGDLVVALPAHWLLKGTGLAALGRIPGILGPEFDAVDPSLPTPKPLDVVFQSPARCGVFTHADATYYSADSGAGVFATGTMGWLDGLNGRQGSRADQLTTRITTNVLVEFAKSKAGRRHPARGR